MTQPSPLLSAPIARTILRLAGPNMAAMSVTVLTYVAEAFYIGQLGTVALAGLALAFPMTMLLMMLSAGSIGGAITGVVSRSLGAGDREGAEALALHAVLLVLLLSLLSAAVFLFGGRVIYSALGGTDGVLKEALKYSDLLFAGCVSMWLGNGFAAIIRATGHMKIAARGLITGAVIQIIAAAVLVFGMGPLPAMGMAGAAAGIVIGYFVAAAILFHYLTFRCEELRLRLKGMKISLSPLVAIMKVGFLSSINSFFSLAAIIILTGYMARLGVDVLAGYGIGARLEFLTIPLIFGFGSASTALVGVHFGAGHYKRGHRAGWTAALFAAVFTGVIGCFFALFPGLWANLFSDVETVRAACRDYLQIAGPFYTFFGLSLCLYFASLGSGRVLWPVIAVFMRVAVVGLGGLYLTNQTNIPAETFYWLIAAGMATQAIVVGTAIRLGAWRRGIDHATLARDPS